ncbi:fic/DOC family protein [Hirsutella rhossiliensis]|uniref:Fic/DOC family domain-containing protein n=1 Tax=Hirsutella rhossiliensis TaxID=111463 RepID=A0A9P8N2U2_9HYPO|nr:fic/DOC family domain-containing protein [Hirsutella rhossiliensis]KAH0965814.1 fic/DOC family domain-containing protein [Hirsutella rhossiliensis]
MSSLDDANPLDDASPSPNNFPTSAPKMHNFPSSLGKTFAAGWPSWRSTRGDPSFTIRLAEQLKDEAAKSHLPEDPATIIHEFRKECQRRGMAAFNEVWSELENALITLVYSSNLIELSGQDLQITTRICQDVFRGKAVNPNIPESESDPEYQRHLGNLLKTHRRGDMPNIIRSRLEVINHAKALGYMIDRVALDNELLSEDLILETHRILFEGLTLDGDIKPGVYRDHEVAVCYSKPGEKKKKSVCIRAMAVPGYMRQMVDHLNDDIAMAEAAAEIDPYTLAARYHHQFVMIHPFGDGNGRLTRIILNVILLKYAGHLTAFGSEGNEKDDYLHIVRRGHKAFNDEDMEVEFHEQTSHHEFARGKDETPA